MSQNHRVKRKKNQGDNFFGCMWNQYKTFLEENINYAHLRLCKNTYLYIKIREDVIPSAVECIVYAFCPVGSRGRDTYL